MSTLATRRIVKSVDSPRRFSPVLKPRRKTFSVLTVATFAVAVFLLSKPLKILSPQPAKLPDGAITTRVSIPLDNLPDSAASAHMREAPAAVGETARQESPVISEDAPTRGEPGKCLKHILYDKPVKTGSTAIMVAIREFLKEDSRVDRPCGLLGPYPCIELAKSICNGTYAEKDYFSLLGHLKCASQELIQCLRPHYYIATSVRDPYQRRKSAYLWNRTLNATHFSIPHTAPFAEFMERLPRCQLHHYYDGKGMGCEDAGIPLEQRIQDIVDRVDEVIDLYDEPVGPLHRLISKHVARENESIKMKEDSYVEEFNKDTLKEETMLYERLREKRLMKPNSNRLPC